MNYKVCFDGENSRITKTVKDANRLDENWETFSTFTAAKHELSKYIQHRYRGIILVKKYIRGLRKKDLETD